MKFLRPRPASPKGKGRGLFALFGHSPRPRRIGWIKSLPLAEGAKGAAGLEKERVFF